MKPSAISQFDNIFFLLGWEVDEVGWVGVSFVNLDTKCHIYELIFETMVLIIKTNCGSF
jgi:hypothetical protein